MANLKEPCSCGRPSVCQDSEGKRLCKTCWQAEAWAKLHQGEVVTVSHGGKPRWTFTPHLDQNGELAILAETDAQTGELKLATYPAR